MKRVYFLFILQVVPIFGVQEEVFWKGESGGSLSYVTLTAAAAAPLYMASEKGDYEGMVSYIVISGLTGLSESVLKTIVPEGRPTDSNERSFPSGHAASSFAAGWYIAKRYGWQEAFPTLALATATSILRVTTGRHYPHDVIAGSAIAFFWVYLTARPAKDLEERKIVEGPRFRITNLELFQGRRKLECLIQF